MVRKVLKLGSFNVRGLNCLAKQQNIIEDVKKYNIDVCCLQETKIKEEVDKNIGGHRFINTGSKNQYYGNGFIVAPEIRSHCHKYWKVDERISCMQLAFDEDQKYRIEDKGPLKKVLTKAKIFKSKIIRKLKMKITRSRPKKIITIINV